MSDSIANNLSVPAANRPRIPADALYQPPAIAWPTFGLFLAALALWLGALFAALNGIIPPALAIFLQSVSAFMQFTVLHDGVHRSLSRQYEGFNALVTNLAGAFLGLVGVGAAFRYAHFKHHRHTNESGNDPDLWSGIGVVGRWMLPLQWATTDFRYGYLILKDWSSIPLSERLKMIGGVLLLVSVFALCVWLGHLKEVLLYWIVPSRLAILWLSFAFNYLPHHPHEVEQRHNPYAATNVRKGAEPVLKWVFLYQNYHLIHHLYPSVPFYRYLKIWRKDAAEYLKRGAPVVPWYGLSPVRRNR
ncbi:MAG TPA: fatty acid desaturase [Stenotrophobium sp.]|nr:fatty acid desaturase [Stenotrophobium sp.]